MKYYVQVNRYLMVSVEAPSALSAEHIFLDLDGIQYSNAFSMEDTATDTFRGAVMGCETISKAELESRSAEYTAAWLRVGKAKDEITTATHEVERIEELLKEAEAKKTEAEKAYYDALATARNAKRTLCLEDE